MVSLALVDANAKRMGGQVFIARKNRHLWRAQGMTSQQILRLFPRVLTNDHFLISKIFWRDGAARK